MKRLIFLFPLMAFVALVTMAVYNFPPEKFSSIDIADQGSVVKKTITYDYLESLETDAATTDTVRQRVRNTSNTAGVLIPTTATHVTIYPSARIGNLLLHGNTYGIDPDLDPNGAVNLEPAGTGDVNLNGDTVVTGTLTANRGVVLNESGLSTSDVRMESDTEVNFFFLDSSGDSGAGQLGIGTNTPASGSIMDVDGLLEATSLRATSPLDGWGAASEQVELKAGGDSQYKIKAYDFNGDGDLPRLAVRSAATNSPAVIQLIPNGTGEVSAYEFFGTDYGLDSTDYFVGSIGYDENQDVVLNAKQAGSPGGSVPEFYHTYNDLFKGVKEALASFNIYPGNASADAIVFKISPYSTAGGGGPTHSPPYGDDGTTVFSVDKEGDTAIAGTVGANNSITAQGTGTPLLVASRYSAGTGSGNLALQHSRHATIGSHTILQANDQIGGILANGSDGSNFDNAANILFLVDGTPGSGTDMPGRIEFQTSPDASATAATRLAVYSSSDVLIQPGLASITASTKASMAAVGGVMNVNTTDVSNTGTGEDDLITYSLPASALATNGDSVEFTVYGTFSADVENKRVRIYFGTTVIFDSTAISFGASDWHAECTVIRTGAATQEAIVHWDSGSALLATATDFSEPTETLSSAVTIKCTGEATTTGAVNQEGLKVKWDSVGS